MSAYRPQPAAPAAPSRSDLAQYRDELGERGLPDMQGAVVALLADLWRWAADGRDAPLRKRRRPGLRLVPSLVKPLTALDAALRSAPTSPGARVDAAQAAHDLAERLDAAGAEETAWGFYAAAAAVAPDEHAYAAAAGRFERRHQRYTAAAQWLARAARLADRAGRSMDATAALIALAGTVEDQEHHALSARLLAFAARYARHRRAPLGEGDALLALGLQRHGLGYTAEAHGFFTDAVLAYGTDHPRLVRAGLEIGRCWLDEAEFVATLKLHEVLLRHVSAPLDAMLAAARLTRAAAATGSEQLMEEWWNGTMRFLGMVPTGVATATALVDLARAAGTWGLRVRARVAAEAALALAQEASDPVLTSAAAYIMAITTLPRVPVELARTVFPDIPGDDDGDDDAEQEDAWAEDAGAADASEEDPWKEVHVEQDWEATAPLDMDPMNPALEPLFNAITCGLGPRGSGSEPPLVPRG
ncbi:MAG: hypothetical protein JWM27_4873 [Gemmatimonadetes bacterium]|nr:hypothetical protein [Gemmatimonadota bacterium]